MFREIKKKKLILENRRPYSSAVTEEMREMDYADWMYSSLRVEGSTLDRSQIRTMLLGDPMPMATVYECITVENYRSVIRRALELKNMNIHVTLKLIYEIYELISGGKKPQLRTDDVMVGRFSYRPLPADQIPEQLQLFSQLVNSTRDDFSGNPLLKAAHLHNRFLEIWPFRDFNEQLARFFMYYYLLCEGYPTFALGLSEAEYIAAVNSYLQREDVAPLYGAIERAVFNKLDLLMHMTARE